MCQTVPTFTLGIEQSIEQLAVALVRRRDEMMDFLEIVINIIWFFIECLLHILFWNSNTKEEKQGCILGIVLFVVLLVVIGTILWFVFWR